MSDDRVVQVVIQQSVDGTAGVAAGAKALADFANASDAVTASTGVLTKTANTWMRQQDEVTKSGVAAALAAKQLAAATLALAPVIAGAGDNAASAARALDNMQAKAAAAAEKAAALRDGLAGVSAAGDGTASASEANAAAFDRLRASLDTAYAASVRFGAANDIIDVALAENANLAGVATAMQIKLAASYAEVIAGLDGTTAAAKAAADADTAAANAAMKRAAAFDNLRTGLDPLYAATQRYTQQTALVSTALEDNVASSEVAATMQAKLAAAYAGTVASLDGSAAAAKAAADATAAAADADALATSAAVKRASAFDSLQASLDPLYAAQQRFAEQSGVIAAGLSDNADLAGTAASMQDRLTAAYAAQTAKLDGSAAAQQAAADATKQAAIDADKLTAALDATQAKYDSSFLASQKLAAGLAEVKALEDAGRLSTVAAATARDALNKSYADSTAVVSAHGEAIGKVTASEGQMRFATQQLEVQTMQFFTSIQGGQSIVTAFVQQGHQVFDVAAATGVGLSAFGEIFKKLGGYVFSTTGLILGAVAGLGYLAYEAESTAEKFNTLQNTLRATRDDYVSLAATAQSASQQFARTPGVSAANATTATTTIASSPNFAGSTADLLAYDKAANQVAVTLGITVPEAATKFIRAGIDNPAAAAATAATSGFTKFNAELTYSIQLMQDSGDKAGATRAYMTALTGSFTEGALKLTPFQQSLNDLDKAFSGADGTGKSFANTLGGIVVSGAGLAIDALTGVLHTLNSIQAARASAAAGSAPVSAATGAIQPIIDQVSAAYHVDPALITTLQGREGESDGKGGWKTSATGAIGAMQVTNSTFKGMQADPANFPGMASANLSDNAGNVSAGVALFSHLLAKYGDVRTAVLAYHDGEGVVDGYLSGKSNNISIAAVVEADAVEQSYSPSSGFDGTKGVALRNPAAHATGTAGTARAAGSVAVAQSSQALSEGFTTAKTDGGPDFQIDANLAKQATLTKSLALIDPSDTAAIAKETDDLRQLRVAYDALVSARTTQSTASRAAMTAADNSRVRTTNTPVELASNKVDETANEKAVTNADAINAVMTKRRDLTLEIADQENRLDHMTPGTAAYDNVKTSVGLLKLSLADTLTAQQKLARGIEDTNVPLASQSGYARTMADVSLQAAQAARTEGADTAALAEALHAKSVQLAADFNDQVAAVDKDTAAQIRIGAAYDGTGGSMAAATAAATAYIAADKDFAPGSQAKADAIALLTSRIMANTAAKAENALKVTTSGLEQDLAYTQAETASLGQNSDARAAMLDKLQAERYLRQQGIPLTDASAVAYLKERDAVTSANLALQAQQTAMSDLSNMATTSFDTISSAITTAFTNGTASSLNFGTILHGIFVTLIADVAKIAILNPVLNNLFGSNLTTGSSLISAVGGAAGATGTAAPATASNGLLGEAQSAFSVGKSVYGVATGGLSNTGIGLVDSTLNASLISGTAGTTGGTFAATGGAISGTAASGGAGLSVGGLLGGAGAGFAAGSLLNNVLGGNQTGGTIGSGVGAAAGAAIGSIIPGVGTLIGGLVGGLAGGGLGGLFGGGGVKHHGWNDVLGSDSNGNLQAISNGADKFDNTPALTAINTQITNLNGIMATDGIKLQPNTKVLLGGSNGVPQPADLAAAFGGLRFMSTDTTDSKDATLNKQLSTRSFATADALTAAVAGLKAYNAVVTPTNVGSVADSITAAQAAYAPALAAAKQFGLALDPVNNALAAAVTAIQKTAQNTVDATMLGLQQRDTVANDNSPGAAQGIKESSYLASQSTARQAMEDQLTALYGTGVQTTSNWISLLAEFDKTTGDEMLAMHTTYLKAMDAAHATANDANESVVSRGMVADATLNNNPAEARAAAMDDFNTGAQKQLRDLATSLTTAFGDTYAGTADYAAKMNQLGQTLYAERQVLVNSQTAATHQQNETNDTTYIADKNVQDRTIVANATLSGDWNAKLQANLNTFDNAAFTESQTLSDSLLSTYGQAYATTAEYAQRMSDLQVATAAERLVLIQQEYDQGRQAATSVVVSLAQYTKGLAIGASSPLSAKDQYATASNTFATEATAAGKGDYKALSLVQTDAQAFLDQSKNLNGGASAQYTADFQKVADMLATIAGLSPDTLTVSALDAISKTQTAALLDALAQQLAEAKALRLEIQHSGSTPARIAA